MGCFTEEMELLDLAPGEPFSQDSQNRSYRYSQSLGCPSAPYNSAGTHHSSDSNFLMSYLMVTLAMVMASSMSQGASCREVIDTFRAAVQSLGWSKFNLEKHTCILFPLPDWKVRL